MALGTNLLGFLAIVMLLIIFVAMVLIVARDKKRIDTLIEAHNALAKDFGQSMEFIKRFNEAVNNEDKK